MVEHRQGPKAGLKEIGYLPSLGTPSEIPSVQFGDRTAGVKLVRVTPTYALYVEIVPKAEESDGA